MLLWSTAFLALFLQEKILVAAAPPSHRTTGQQKLPSVQEEIELSHLGVPSDGGLESREEFVILSKYILENKMVDVTDDTGKLKSLCSEIDEIRSFREVKLSIEGDVEWIDRLLNIAVVNLSEKSDSLLLEWIVKYAEKIGGHRVVSSFRRITLRMMPNLSAWEHLKLIIPENYRKYTEPSRAEVDAAAEAGKLSFITQSAVAGVFPTENGIVTAIQAGCVPLLSWHMSEGFYWSDRIKYALTRFIGRHELAGEQFTEGPNERVENTLSLLSAVKKHGVLFHYDFADSVCAYGAVSTLNRIIENGYPVSPMCLDFAAATGNHNVIKRYFSYLEQTHKGRTPVIVISKFAVNMACRWGDLDSIQLMLRSGGSLPPQCLNIAAKNGHVAILKTFYHQRAKVEGRLSWKWALKGGNEAVIEFLNQNECQVTIDDLRTAAECRNEKWLEILRKLLQIQTSASDAGSEPGGDNDDERDGEGEENNEDDDDGSAVVDAFEDTFGGPDGSDIKIIPLPVRSPQEQLDEMITSGASLDSVKEFSQTHTVFPTMERIERVDIISWLLDVVKPMTLTSDQYSLVFAQGQFEDYEKVASHRPTVSALNSACRRGSLEILKDCYTRHNILPDSEGANEAALAGHLSILRWLCSLDVPPTTAALKGNDYEDTVIFVLEHADPFNYEDITDVVAKGMLDAIRTIESFDDTLWQFIMTRAMEHGSLSIVMYLYEKRKLLPTQRDIDSTIGTMSLKMAQWLTTHKLFPSYLPLTACKNAKVVSWIFKNHPLYYSSSLLGNYVSYGYNYMTSPYTSTFTESFMEVLREKFKYTELLTMDN